MEPRIDESAPTQELAQQETTEAKPRFRIIKLEESVAPAQEVNMNPTHGNGCGGTRRCCRCGR